MKPTRKPARLDFLADRLKKLIGSHGFVRRDLARRALFVSDYAMRADEQTIANLDAKLSQNGWQVYRMDKLTLLDLPFEGYQDVFEGIAPANFQGYSPQKGLSALFSRQETAFLPDMLEDARLALLRWDADEKDLLMEQAGAALAISLRKKTPVPSYYPLLLKSL